MSAVLGLMQPTAALSQAIPRDEYIRYVPLEVPRVIRQTPASARLRLYGDARSPDYRDVDPVDGVDDARLRLFRQLATRFSPFMVQNTIDMPMDLKRFRGGAAAMTLNVDTWNTMSRPNALEGSRGVSFFPIAPVPCQGEVQLPIVLDSRTIANLRESDCVTLELLAAYRPFRPATGPLREDAVEIFERWFQVLWLDYPGRSPADWKEIFENPFSERLRDEWQGLAKIYMHPFLREIVEGDGAAGYEFVLQYWFFYPLNDGGNNHAGDWEHLNVVISPKDRVTRNLTEKEVISLANGQWMEASGDEELVIKRLDYYFHSKVMQLDYSRPNAYLPRAQWQAQIDGLIRQRGGIEWEWREIRRRAYQNAAETRINTHPIAFIGADNKGTDQVFSRPGGTNRDSHGTFPFPALYKDVGPGGATENISQRFDHWAYLAASPEERVSRLRLDYFGRGGVLTYNEPSKVEVIPDWERVAKLVTEDYRVRAQWSWLMLPIRFGYPAVESPFAGIVSHAETGNLSVVGPAFNNGWNRSGATAQYSDYDPHLYPRFYQLGWQDGFINDWGYFNLTFPSWIMIPPFDFLWKFLGLPLRAALSANDPAFFPTEKLPYRALGVQGGAAWMIVPEAYGDLFAQDPHFDEIILRLLDFAGISGGDSIPDVTVESDSTFIDTAFSPYFEVDFFVGQKFASQNRIRNSTSELGEVIKFADIPEPFRLTSELNFWEYTGFLRFALLPGGFQPYIKPGYGVSWYRLQNISTNDEPIPNADTDWITKFTLSLGAGFEFTFIRSRAKPPRGLDFSIVAEYVRAWNGLGLDFANLPLETLIVLLGRTPEELPRDRTVGRNMFFLGLTISL